MNDQTSMTLEAWEQLAEVIASGNAEHLAAFLQLLAPEETAYTIGRLDVEQQTAMLSMLTSVHPEQAADLMEHFADELAADMIEALEPRVAAAIFDQMDSDEQTDVLGEMDDADAEAILDQMVPEEAEDARKRLTYDEQTAGGLMITELLVFQQDKTVESVVTELRDKAAANQEYEVRYIYVVDEAGRLMGVVPIRQLVMSQRGVMLTQLMTDKPTVVVTDESLDDLNALFDRVPFSAVPVVDGEAMLVGVVQRAATEEAIGERSGEQLAKFGGIIGGEEYRSMPLTSRSMRRLAFLLPVMFLTLISASLIAMFEGTIHRLPILAAFLPVVAGLCGSGGNQAVAVSIRELSLGLVKPEDARRVLLKEVGIGIINGLTLGILIGVVIGLWRGELMIAVLVAVAVPITATFGVCVGGAVPLLLKRIGIDPATASGPIVQTTIDMFGFLVLLTLAMLAWAIFM